MKLLHHTKPEPMINQCPLTDPCHAVTKINCVDRDYQKCEFFKNLIAEYCDRIFRQCKVCKYRNFCNLDRKKKL